MMGFEQVISNYTDIKPISQKDDGDKVFTTYYAVSKTTGSKVILKEIDINKKELYSRLLDQKHKNVCKINFVYETTRSLDNVEQNFLLVETEYIEGATLAEYVETKGVLTIDKTLDMALQLCDGLEFLHDNGIIHKDLSISNVLVTNDGQAKIIDFGYSRIENKLKKYETTNIYTYGSTAPEVNAGEKVDKRADIYSLGKLIQFMLVGNTYGAKYKGKLRLEKIIRKCIKVKIKERYKSIKNVKKHLLKICPQKNLITKRYANIRVIVGVIVASFLTFIFFMSLFYIPEPVYNYEDVMMAKNSELWDDIYYDLQVTRDYDDAIIKLERLIENELKTEDVYIYYANCFIEKKDYNRAADVLIEYLRDVYKYPNLTTDTKESYVLLSSIENNVSKQQLAKINKEKKEASIYIDKWTLITDYFSKKEYDKTLKLLDEVIEDGAKVDCAYFLKVESLLGMDKKSDAKKVYTNFVEMVENFEDVESIEYDTIDYAYEKELRDKLR